MIVEFYQRDAPSICVRATPTEWKKLVAPAEEFDFPVDGTTVDTEVMYDLMSRPHVKGKPAKSVRLA